MKPTDANTRIHPTRIAALLDGSLSPTDLRPDEVAELAGRIAAAQMRLLLEGLATGDSKATRETEDRLLKASEAAAKLGSTVDWLYRNHRKLPFTVSLGKGQLRFSERGIGKFIASQQRGRGGV
jgi:predicted DNA-binding transcriptional regulator AlpA